VAPRVNENAGAGLRVGVDVRRQLRVRRDGARRVVVVPGDADARVEQALERLPVPLERDVEHRDAVASDGGDAAEQRDVALDAGDDDRLDRIGEPQLPQREQPVRVAVADVVVRHRRRATAPSSAPPTGRAPAWTSCDHSRR
jgi:hypothetical protein